MSRFVASVWVLGFCFGLPACTLVTDVDRSKIKDTAAAGGRAQEPDSGAGEAGKGGMGGQGGEDTTPDAAVPDSGVKDGGASGGATDAGNDAAAPMDASADAG
jgi:hypothetical protein